MGQKTNPVGFRLGINRPWDSIWCTHHNSYATLLHEDHQIRSYIQNKLAVSKIDVGSICISRTTDSVKIKATVSKERLDTSPLEKTLRCFLRKPVVLELITPVAEAKLLACEIGHLIEKRVPLPQLKRAIVKLIDNYHGAKVSISGRFNGATMARREIIQQGRVPLQTIRAFIDYGAATAYTVYGTFGVKVWLNMDKD